MQAQYSTHDQGSAKVENPKGFSANLGMPLLRSPFSGARQIAVSSWKAGAVGPNVTKVHQTAQTAIAAKILKAGVGGSFWKSGMALPRGTFHVLVLPPNLAAARQCWQLALTRNLASHLLVILPYAHSLASLAAEINAAGAAIARVGNPHPVLDIARTVYASSPCDLTQLAGLAGRPVFYTQSGSLVEADPDDAQYCITQDTAYQNPYTGGPASCDETIELLAEWKRVFAANREIAGCTGMSMWKRHRIGQLLHTGQATPIFFQGSRAALRAAEHGGAVAAWSTRLPHGLVERAAAQKVAVLRVEDGFIRSAGLGSNLQPPASIIVDRNGIYFDPSRPSDLELLIAKTEFSEALIARAQRLIGLMLAGGISKYAAGGPRPVLAAKPGQRIILVPGQVSDDLSLQMGATGPVRDNIALLKAVRARHPDGFIVYRPHPDVTAGNRQGAIADPVAAGLADQLAPDGAMAALLEAVDEVHTMTSLAGFEALLRGRVVETYGQPFYASWGLTIDHAPVRRRQRRVSLAELVAAALILYPLYVDPKTGLPCGPEILISRMEQKELWRPGLLMRLQTLHGQFLRPFRNAGRNSGLDTGLSTGRNAGLAGKPANA